MDHIRTPDEENAPPDCFGRFSGTCVCHASELCAVYSPVVHGAFFAPNRPLEPDSLGLVEMKAYPGVIVCTAYKEDFTHGQLFRMIIQRFPDIPLKTANGGGDRYRFDVFVDDPLAEVTIREALLYGFAGEAARLTEEMIEAQRLAETLAVQPVAVLTDKNQKEEAA